MSSQTMTTTTANVNPNTNPSNGSDKQTKALEILTQGVMERLSSETWKAALNFRKKFHNYSFNNQLLIMLQNPDATQVAGYGKWQELKRQVRKGEKGIAILAPILITKRDEDTDEKRQILVGFKTVYVFDIAQTNGEPIPEIPRPKLLEGYEDEAAELVKRLEDYIATQGWEYHQEDQGNGIRGSWNPVTKTLTVNPDLPMLSKAKTLAHEIAHAVAEHGIKNKDYQFGELEAESTAYLILDAFDFDASDYSFDYIAHWAGDETMASAVIDAGKNAAGYADKILKALTEENPAIAA